MFAITLGPVGGPEDSGGPVGPGGPGDSGGPGGPGGSGGPGCPGDSGGLNCVGASWWSWRSRKWRGKRRKRIQKITISLIFVSQ